MYHFQKEEANSGLAMVRMTIAQLFLKLSWESKSSASFNFSFGKKENSLGRYLADWSMGDCLDVTTMDPWTEVAV
jgi:hypothetical protein